jgi:hypothetical protein
MLGKSNRNSLIDVAREPCVPITIVEDIEVEKNITRIILLTTTRRKGPKLIW